MSKGAGHGPHPVRFPVAALVLLAACTADSEKAMPKPAAAELQVAPGAPRNEVARILASDDPVLGMFSGDHTAAQGVVMGEQEGVDFVFYDLETGAFDMSQMREYMRGMREGAEGPSGAEAPPPVLLRIPPMRDLGRKVAQDYVRQGLAEGVRGVVFPHVTTPAEATTAADLVGDDVWPRSAQGALISIVIIEDREAVDRAREIARADGVAVVLLGPNDLLRSYQDDAAAVESAIQAVLSACQEIAVPCGITATADDIAQRIDEGFRFLLVREPEALAAGLAAAGRR